MSDLSFSQHLFLGLLYGIEKAQRVYPELGRGKTMVQSKSGMRQGNMPGNKRNIQNKSRKMADSQASSHSSVPEVTTLCVAISVSLAP